MKHILRRMLSAITDDEFPAGAGWLAPEYSSAVSMYTHHFAVLQTRPTMNKQASVQERDTFASRFVTPATFGLNAAGTDTGKFYHWPVRGATSCYE